MYIFRIKHPGWLVESHETLDVSLCGTHVQFNRLLANLELDIIGCLDVPISLSTYDASNYPTL